MFAAALTFRARPSLGLTTISSLPSVVICASTASRDTAFSNSDTNPGDAGGSAVVEGDDRDPPVSCGNGARTVEKTPIDWLSANARSTAPPIAARCPSCSGVTVHVLPAAVMVMVADRCTADPPRTAATASPRVMPPTSTPAMRDAGQDAVRARLLVPVSRERDAAEREHQHARHDADDGEGAHATFANVSALGHG